MAFADMIILNKVDLVDRAQVDRIKEWLDSRFHRYRLVKTCRGDVPLEVLLSVGRFDPGRMDHAHCTDPACCHKHAEHDHSDAFSTWSYETDQPLSLEALREAARKLPATIYRAKGVIYSSDAPERRAILQVVGKRVELSLQDEWDERVPRTQIVVIGSAGGVDGTALRNQIETSISRK
jgi:G3E family GTPase